MDLKNKNELKFSETASKIESIRNQCRYYNGDISDKKQLERILSDFEQIRTILAEIINQNIQNPIDYLYKNCNGFSNEAQEFIEKITAPSQMLHMLSSEYIEKLDEIVIENNLNPQATKSIAQAINELNYYSEISTPKIINLEDFQKNQFETESKVRPTMTAKFPSAKSISDEDYSYHSSQPENKTLKTPSHLATNHRYNNCRTNSTHKKINIKALASAILIGGVLISSVALAKGCSKEETLSQSTTEYAETVSQPENSNSFLESIAVSTPNIDNSQIITETTPDWNQLVDNVKPKSDDTLDNSLKLLKEVYCAIYNQDHTDKISAENIEIYSNTGDYAEAYSLIVKLNDETIDSFYSSNKQEASSSYLHKIYSTNEDCIKSFTQIVEGNKRKRNVNLYKSSMQNIVDDLILNNDKNLENDDARE